MNDKKNKKHIFYLQFIKKPIINSFALFSFGHFLLNIYSVFEYYFVTQPLSKFIQLCRLFSKLNFLKVEFQHGTQFAKVKSYAIQQNIELEFERIKFQVCHISLNCIKLDFIEIEFNFKLDFEKVMFVKMLHN